MQVWILDDSHFPTGYANGAVRKVPEELKQWYLRHYEMDIAGPVEEGEISIYADGQESGGLLQKGEVLEAALLMRRMEENSLKVSELIEDITDRVENGWLRLNLSVEKARLLLVIRTRENQSRFSDYIDMTNPQSVDLLLSEVYEKHYRRYADKFGSVITAFFSDEPGFYNSDDASGYSFRCQIGADMRVPWNSYIAEEFQKRLPEADAANEKNGSLLRQSFPALWFPHGERTEEIRAAYMDALTELYRRHFTERIARWCHMHHVSYVGHVIEDNNVHARLGCGPGHYFRAVSGQDMAGIDVVLQQVLPGMDCLQYGFSSRGVQDGAFNFYGLAKLGASQAHLDRRTKGRAMCEIYGAYGWGEDIRLMKWLADHMLVRGINYFVPHAFSEKDFPDSDCPPHFYAHGYNPQYRYMPVLFTYINRMCHLLNGGRAKAKVGVLYHAELEWRGRSVYFHSIGKELFRHQIDYEVLALDALENAVIAGGKIQYGAVEISVLLLPLADAYPEKLLKLLKICRDNGVALYQVTGKLPDGGRETKLWQFETSETGQELCDCCQLAIEKAAEALPEDVRELQLEVKNGNPGWLRYYHYEMENGRQLYMLFNESLSNVLQGNFRIKGLPQVCRFDGLENRLSKLPQEGEYFGLKLYPGESCVLVETDTEEAGEKQEGGGKITWQEYEGKVTVSRASYEQPENFCVYEEIDVRDGKRLPLPEQKHPAFAGVIRYEFEVQNQPGVELELDLGEVMEAASVWEDGKAIGTRISYPYHFSLGKQRQKSSRIRIEVATTLAHVVRDPFSRHMVLHSEGIKGPIRIGKSVE